MKKLLKRRERNLKITVYRLIFRDQLKIPAFVCSWETFSPLEAQIKKRSKRAFICVLFYCVSGKFILKNSAISGKISSGKYSICFFCASKLYSMKRWSVSMVLEFRLNVFYDNIMIVTRWKFDVHNWKKAFHNPMHLSSKIDRRLRGKSLCDEGKQLIDTFFANDSGWMTSVKKHNKSS
jgi:hypothetical protein